MYYIHKIIYKGRRKMNKSLQNQVVCAKWSTSNMFSNADMFFCFYCFGNKCGSRYCLLPIVVVWCVFGFVCSSLFVADDACLQCCCWVLNYCNQFFDFNDCHITHSSKNTWLQYSSTNINTQGHQSKLFLLEYVIMFNY